MENTMYVVFVTTVGAAPSFKVFSKRGDGITFAEQQIAEGADAAEVYEAANVKDARAAKAAVEMGAGKLVDVRGKKATAEQIRDYELSQLL